MKTFSSKRRVVIAAVMVLLLLFLVRPGASRLKARIASSIGNAVGRPVEVGSVHLRFLPPGFDLENLVVHEDPTFGAEPMLRAPEVTAVVRLTSLLRGRLDIARLELTEPSLNLVRRSDGRWNLEALLERTARTPLAPTSKSKSEARAGFPYIEASSGRINLKSGAEKKPYALLNADFSLWQESENTWGVRLKAEPLRTDMSLNDAGMMRMNGTWLRAGSLQDTPLQFNLEWDRAQLGQLSKLVSGNDKDWRGEVRLNATLSGTPAAMQVVADASIQDFHRYDIPSSEGLRLVAHCDARYRSAEGMIHEIFCSAPVGIGMISLHGDAGLPGAGVRELTLSLNLESVPMSAVAQLARRAKKNLPSDLTATGSLQGNVVIKQDAASRKPELNGHGEITDFRVQSASAKVDLSPGNIPFALVSTGGVAPTTSAAMKALKTRVLPPRQEEVRIEYGPFPVALGRTAPAQARGWIAGSGYVLTVRGEGEVGHTLRAASLLGLPAIKANIEGAIQMDLVVAGSWARNSSGTSADFSLPEITGMAQLHNLRTLVQGVNGPIEIASAELRLSPEEVSMEKLSARAAGAHWTGSVTLPRSCGVPGACLVRFNLNTDEVALSDLRAWLSFPSNERRWYQILTNSQPSAPSLLQSLRAAGKVSAGHLLIHNLIGNAATASLDLERGKLKLADFRVDLLGGKHRGDWLIDSSAGTPVYTGSGTLTAISLDRISDAMNDGWISGTGGGAYQITASGADSEGFWKSLDGKLQFDLRDGTLSHISLGSDDQPLRIGRWQGHSTLRGGKIEIDKSTLVSPFGTYEISGTASLGRELDLKLVRNTEVSSARAGSMVYSITGTLAEPLIAVMPLPETQAQLKP